VFIAGKYLKVVYILFGLVEGCVYGTHRYCFSFSKVEVRQSRMIIGTTAQYPVIVAIALPDRQIVDASDPPSHQSMFLPF
jgi:hypothetical protein